MGIERSNPSSIVLRRLLHQCKLQMDEVPSAQSTNLDIPSPGSAYYTKNYSVLLIKMLRRSAQSLIPRLGGQVAAGFQSGSLKDGLSCCMTSVFEDNKDISMTNQMSKYGFDWKRCTCLVVSRVPRRVDDGRFCSSSRRR